MAPNGGEIHSKETQRPRWAEIRADRAGGRCVFVNCAVSLLPRITSLRKHTFEIVPKIHFTGVIRANCRMADYSVMIGKGDADFRDLPFLKATVLDIASLCIAALTMLDSC